MAITFLKKSGDKYLFNGSGELIFYVPEKYFETNNAVIIGELVEVLGIFDYDVFYDNGKHYGIKNFCFPTTITCKPYIIEKVSAFQLTKDSEPKDYRLLKFKKDDEVISNENIPKGIYNTEKFMNLLLHGHLPNTIPYDKLHEYIAYNAQLNGFNYNMSAQAYGIMASELCRDSQDYSKPFRITDMKNMTDYKFLNIKVIPKHISPYVAITSENADESIANAIINKSNSDSPLERVMMN